MGNEFSKQSDSKKPSLLSEINFIATNYILTQNFTDMENLADSKYCDKLVVLTSKIIASKLTNLEIKYLAQKMRYGKETNIPAKDTVILIDKSNLDDLDVTNKVKKRRICIGIAKFYVQIAHLFAAIVKTINPAYTYKVDRDGVEIKETVSLSDKSKIPKGTVITIKANNICDNRINALLSRETFSQLKTDGKDTVTITPKVCDIINGKSLKSLPGIPELETLYYDIYDYDRGGIDGPITNRDENQVEIQQHSKMSVSDTNADTDAIASSQQDSSSAAKDTETQPESVTEKYFDKAQKWYSDLTEDIAEQYKNIEKKYSGETSSTSGGGKSQRKGFIKMSDRAKEVYSQDVYDFWKTLTGKTTIPMKDGVPTIQRFSDINLDDYERTSDCGSDGKYKKSYTIKKSNSLFVEYANNIKNMMQITNDARDKLLKILLKLFAKTKNEKTDKIEVVIHPDLTESSLKILIDETRSIIVKLYITCEKSFKEGVKILDAIIDKKKFDLNSSLTQDIEDKLDNLLFLDTQSKQTNDYTVTQKTKEESKPQELSPESEQNPVSQEPEQSPIQPKKQDPVQPQPLVVTTMEQPENLP